mmetsp:Transcript_34166/g.72703  ORF Transcript_34166/g.72703 Transcript_34166/m.72703 type:complete len:342 (-) Transcript_34166:134-1159(-)
MKFEEGMVGVITGAASGLGREMAILLAQRGVSLGLSDIDLEGLEQTKSICQMHAREKFGGKPKFLTMQCDVTKSQEVFAFAAEVEKVLAPDGKIDFVAANAGVGSTGLFAEEPLEVTERVININLMGVIYTAKAFIKMLQKQTRGSCLLFISSLYAVAAPINQSSYAASKYAVRGLGETIMREMWETSPHVQVTVAHPGFCKTGIFRHTHITPKEGCRKAVTMGEKLATGQCTSKELEEACNPMCCHTAQSAAETMVLGVERGATRLLISPETHVWDFLARVAPRLAYTPIPTILANLFTYIGGCTMKPLHKPGVPSIGVDRFVALVFAFFLFLFVRRMRK